MNRISLVVTPVSFVVALVMAGCSSGDTTAASSGSGADTVAQSVADTSCRVVTRAAGESTRGGAPWELSTDADGTQWLVWRGTVDVDADDVRNGADVQVTWSHNVESDAGHWYTTRATPVDGAGAGFQRYEFALTQGTYGADDDGYQYGELDIQFIPFLQLADGTRLYDHNRTGGNYTMDSQFDYRVTDDASVCPAASGS